MNFFEKYFRFHVVFLIYFLVLNSSLKLTYSDVSNSFLKIRPVKEGITPTSWLDNLNIGGLNFVLLNNEKTKLYFEFQDIRNSNITKTKEYFLWNYDLLYVNYIDNVNSKLKPT
jgi:hypothetical protein